MFTSSGNSSLTRDIISDVFPTLAVKRRKNYFNKVLRFYITSNLATTQESLLFVT